MKENNNEIISVIDIGTTKIIVLVAEYDLIESILQFLENCFSILVNIIILIVQIKEKDLQVKKKRVVKNGEGGHIRLINIKMCVDTYH